MRPRCAPNVHGRTHRETLVLVQGQALAEGGHGDTPSVFFPHRTVVPDGQSTQTFTE